MPKIINEKIKIEKLGEDKYKIIMTSTQERNREHLKAVIKDNMVILEQLEKQASEITEFLEDPTIVGLMDEVLDELAKKKVKSLEEKELKK